MAINKNSGQTVFTVPELSQLVDGYSGKKMNSALKYAVGHGDLIRITRGIYALDNRYSKLELGNKYKSPSYISFYTVLVKKGFIFQPYSSIFLASRRSTIVDLDGQKYVYRKIKDTILLNHMGIEIESGVAWASPERAICDKIYLDGDEYFDNLRSINWGLMKKLNAYVYGKNKVIDMFIAKNSR